MIADYELVVLAARMSLIISSAERVSFHVPEKRLAQPFSWVEGCSVMLIYIHVCLTAANLSIFSRSNKQNRK